MMPSRSMRLTRSVQGVVDSPTFSASSVMAMRPFFCRMRRILRSILSSALAEAEIDFMFSLFMCERFENDHLILINFSEKNQMSMHILAEFTIR